MSSLYNYSRNLMATGQFDWETDDFGVALLKSGYTFDPDHTDFATIVLSGAVIVTFSTLTLKSVVNGACDADNALVLTSSTDTLVALVVIYSGIGVRSGKLVAYIDGPGLPHILDGVGVKLVWDNGDNRIFRV